MKRSYLKRKTPLKRGGRLRVVGHSPAAEIKREIQRILRLLVIKRDGGCILRDYPQTGVCGGYAKNGELIYQAEHLHTRSNAASFACLDLVVCLCQRHHIYYKPQHADEYYQIVKKHIGEKRSKLLKAVQEDRKAHKIDWKLQLFGLQLKLEDYEKNTDN